MKRRAFQTYLLSIAFAGAMSPVEKALAERTLLGVSRFSSGQKKRLGVLFSEEVYKQYLIALIFLNNLGLHGVSDIVKFWKGQLEVFHFGLQLTIAKETGLLTYRNSYPDLFKSDAAKELLSALRKQKGNLKILVTKSESQQRKAERVRESYRKLGRAIEAEKDTLKLDYSNLLSYERRERGKITAEDRAKSKKNATALKVKLAKEAAKLKTLKSKLQTAISDRKSKRLLSSCNSMAAIPQSC